MLVGAELPDEGADRRIHGGDSTTLVPRLPGLTARRPRVRRADTMARVSYPPPPSGYRYLPCRVPDHPHTDTVLAVASGIMAAS